MNTNYVYTEAMDSTIVTYYYETLREKLYSICYYMKKGLQSLDTLDESIKAKYLIDEEPVANVLLESTKTEIESRMDYIQNTIIPLVTSKMNGQ